ncbi:MAG: 3-oxoacyl-ACP reductase FabG [Planctomycetes bacterium]|nr:3-oxoacyl-ACP reductase FabG [Planctomycetota bacterium]
MTVDLSGKKALVTGASTGIGRAIALALARNGADVVVNYRSSKSAAEELARDIRAMGRRSLAIQADVSRKPDVERLFAEAEAPLGPTLDILVNNAGALISRELTAVMKEETFDRVVAVNFKSVFLCSQAAIPRLVDGSGRVINLTSVAARNGGGPGAGVYAASKAAVSCFTKNLARELAPRGITVNGIAPGVIATPFHEKYSTPELMQRFAANTPLGHNGVADDCVGATLFLVSPEAGFITGETIEVNGGMLMD